MRGDADASCAAPRLTLEEKAGIAEKHAKKQVDAQKRGVSVMLRDIMAHKVLYSASFKGRNQVVELIKEVTNMIRLIILRGLKKLSTHSQKSCDSKY